ncbi:quinone-dependent dihydroorotate dehydrogenase [Paracoccus suum]|uniref:Dihydroorotate dehydrogenase (quinone) n=1 Tax=Paracoccus suum TaxID=2259340 RepID=A0A344PLS9_9RHOB|nr:quinone-dependent dihydroorotate dehydrogenase [Paracoccus suum]AXC50334.1 quinone-dependent dihydroorotate dehydrogenase [Paracoccus suum]
MTHLRERLGLAALHRLPPETAHQLAISALARGLAPLHGGPVTSDRLVTQLAGMTLPNPVGLAAGFDKNAVVAEELSRAGFGFVEVGAATPRAQPGNPRPRLFRLSAEGAIINRFGFNNDGAAMIAARLAAGRPFAVPVGLNIGANKDSPDRAADFSAVVAEAGHAVDFLTVNVSSPNTERLRDLQGPAALEALLAGVLATRDRLAPGVPVLLKIAPDLSEAELADLAGVALNSGVSAIIATNTTLSRDGVSGPHAAEAGGLSGAPLLGRSTAILARLARLTAGRIPLIGVGGVTSAEDAWDKLRAGASAVQLYSALVYQGLSLAPRIAEALDERLAREGFANVAEVSGSGIDDYL